LINEGVVFRLPADIVVYPDFYFILLCSIIRLNLYLILLVLLLSRNIIHLGVCSIIIITLPIVIESMNNESRKSGS
jgi:hypothetical protein